MNEQRIPPMIYLLCAMVIFLIITAVTVSRLSPNDGQTFQLVAGALTTFIGVLANQITPDPKKPALPPGTVRDTSIEQHTAIPPAEPPA